MKRWLTLGALVLSATLLMTGCGGNEKGTDSSGGDKQKASDARPLSFMEESEIGSMDTIYTQDEPSINAQSNVFEGLYQLDKDDNVIPAVAKEMPEISEDGKTYVIKLREDSTWSNGDPVTAHDFIFAWRKLVNPEKQANYVFLTDGMIENATDIINNGKDPKELGVKAVDDYTIEIKLEKPVPYFTSLLAFSPFFPQNEKFVTEKGSEYGTSSENIVSNGPFIMNNWDQSSLTWELEKNPDYYDADKVKSDLINFQVIKETNTAFNLFESGELDIAFLSGELAQQNVDDPEYEAIQRSKIYSIRMNQIRNGKDSIFANENVRKAVAYAIDKKGLVDNILADGSKEIYGYIPWNFVFNPETKADFREDAGELAVTDVEKAKEYLAKAKTELQGDVEMELLAKDGDSDKKVAEFIQSQLEESLPGLKVTIKTVPLNNSIEIIKKGDYDLAIGTWAPDYQDPMTFFESYTTGNTLNYSSEKYDQLIDDVINKYGNDLGKRWETLIEVEKQFVEEDAALIPLYQQGRAQLTRAGLTGLEYHNFGPTCIYKYAYIE
ncbi:peptide ABC transporter substrate-binding protein [Vagococcus elongatus]|uniref:Peptide ABC transporter substrate-binding protein n=1 Tax=Vagococcus elongatus TaxID=180344 RepID=A0A430B5E6_9ENTE|nr:peptide ABC transporter substrate-binding protein [Vagococcus elongatus]RSU15519.1 peptide ABC transporter substrate-binding protein [Vagococcus elongatus]